MSASRIIFKNFTSLMGAQIVSFVLGFFAVIYLVRVLDADGFGKINFAMAVVVYFTLLTDLGLPMFGIREVARDRANVRKYVGDILTLRMLFAVGAFLLVLALAFLLNKPQEIKLLIVLYGLGLLPSALLVEWAFQGVEKMEYIGLSRALAAATYTGLVLGIVRGPEDILLVPIFHVCATVLSVVLLMSIFIRKYGPPTLRFPRESLRYIVLSALPIGLAGMLVQAIYYMDTVMLGFMRTVFEVGYYSAAYKIIFLLIGVVGIYFNSVFPPLCSYYKTSLDAFRELMSHSVRLMMVLAWPLAVGITILAAPIMSLIYGVGYENGVIALQILIWSMALICINTPYAWGLWASDRQNRYLRVVSIQTVGNFILNLLMIPPLGLVGASLATVAAELIGIPLYYRELKKVVHVPLLGHAMRPLIASVPMGLALYMGVRMGLNVLLLAGVGVVVYFVVLYLVRGITEEDKRLILSLIGR